MTEFAVVESPDGTLTAVKRGVAWLALLTGPFWALYHRLWLLAFLTLALSEQCYRWPMLGPRWAALIWGGLPALAGNYWRLWALRKNQPRLEVKLQASSEALAIGEARRALSSAKRDELT